VDPEIPGRSSRGVGKLCGRTGKGHITTGLEDVLDLGSGSAASLVTFSNGTYQIQGERTGTDRFET